MNNKNTANQSLLLKYKYKNRNLKFCSNYVIQFYKKYLSTKLTNYYSNCKYKNLITFKKINISIASLINKSKIFYNRKELIPIRIFRYFLYFDILKLAELGITFLINPKKLNVYNGKRAKPINILQDLYKIL